MSVKPLVHTEERKREHLSESLPPAVPAPAGLREFTDQIGHVQSAGMENLQDVHSGIAAVIAGRYGGVLPAVAEVLTILNKTLPGVRTNVGTLAGVAYGILADENRPIPALQLPAATPKTVLPTHLLVQTGPHVSLKDGPTPPLFRPMSPVMLPPAVITHGE